VREGSGNFLKERSSSPTFDTCHCELNLAQKKGRPVILCTTVGK